jgi:hypothetical protein
MTITGRPHRDELAPARHDPTASLALLRIERAIPPPPKRDQDGWLLPTSRGDASRRMQQAKRAIHRLERAIAAAKVASDHAARKQAGREKQEREREIVRLRRWLGW